MLRRVPSLLGVCLLASLVQAQAGPGISAGFPGGKADKTFTVINLDKNAGLFTITSTTKQIQQIQLTKSGIAGLKAGQWAATLTLGALGTTYGGEGNNNRGVAMGLFDRSVKPPTFKPNHMADKMNAAATLPFGLMIEPHKGLYAVVDWNDAPRISYRASNTANFTQTPIKFTVATGAQAMPATAYIDPAITKVHGKLVLFYNEALSLVYRPVTVTFNTAKTAITAAVVTDPVTTVWAPAADTPHSPTPIIDTNGNCQGLLCCLRATGNDSDMFFKTGLNKNQPCIKFSDNTGHQNNGGVAGGSFMFAEGTTPSAYTDIYAARGAWMLGSNPAINTIATITIGCHVPRNAPTQVATTMVAVGLSTMKPVTIPGFYGQFGLGPNWLILGTAVAIDKDERAHFPIPIPNDNNLKGVEVVLQGLAAPPAGNPVLTNTAYIRVQK